MCFLEYCIWSFLAVSEVSVHFLAVFQLCPNMSTNSAYAFLNVSPFLGHVFQLHVFHCCPYKLLAPHTQDNGRSCNCVFFRLDGGLLFWECDLPNCSMTLCSCFYFSTSLRSNNKDCTEADTLRGHWFVNLLIYCEGTGVLSELPTHLQPPPSTPPFTYVQYMN